MYKQLLMVKKLGFQKNNRSHRTAEGTERPTEFEIRKGTTMPNYVHFQILWGLLSGIITVYFSVSFFQCSKYRYIGFKIWALRSV